MKPVIGITGGLDGDSLRLRQDYVSAIVNSGGAAGCITFI